MKAAARKYRVVELTQGFVTVIDAEDWRRVNKYKWHTHVSRGTKKKPGAPYARTNIKGEKVYLHRFLMQQDGCDDPSLHVDHKNHQTLDNRRKENLVVIAGTVNCARRRNRKAAAC